MLRSYMPKVVGPYPQASQRRNKVPCTPVQVEAIRSGMIPGLTMVVGPPGTGKTFTGARMICRLVERGIVRVT